MGAALGLWAMGVDIKAPTYAREKSARLLLVAMALEAHDSHEVGWVKVDRTYWADRLNTRRVEDVSELCRVLMANDLIRRTRVYSDGKVSHNNRGRWLLRGPFGW